MHRFKILPLGRIAFWGLVLNAVWEFVQCIFLYDMSEWGFWRITVWMWSTIAGDVVIVLGIAFLSAAAVGTHHLAPLDRVGWAALFGIGFLSSVLLEWLALVLDLWSYSPLMPTLELVGHEVGLAPIVQITILPALSIYFAQKRGYQKTSSPTNLNYKR